MPKCGLILILILMPGSDKLTWEPVHIIDEDAPEVAERFKEAMKKKMTPKQKAKGK